MTETIPKRVLELVARAKSKLAEPPEPTREELKEAVDDLRNALQIMYEVVESDV